VTARAPEAAGSTRCASVRSVPSRAASGVGKTRTEALDLDETPQVPAGEGCDLRDICASATVAQDGHIEVMHWARHRSNLTEELALRRGSVGEDGC
jgi:hypothetical protein